MATALFIFILLAVYHFFMENAVVPVLLDRVKNNFNDLAEQARDAMSKAVNKEDITALNDLALSAESTREIVDLFNLLEFSRFKTNVSEPNKVYANLKDATVKRLYRRYSQLVRKSFLINMQGWTIYVLPLLLFKQLLNKRSLEVKIVKTKPAQDAYNAYREELSTYKKNKVEMFA